MNPTPNNNPDVNRASGAAVGFAIASVIFLVLVVVVKLAATPPAIDADRVTLISQMLYETRTNEVRSLNNAAWIDKSRGIVRLPIDTAMQMAAQAGQNPAAARANLIARAKQANAPAPKAAAKPSLFE